jgi:hypothetical protein
MQRPAIGGGGPIGIVTCNSSGKELHGAMSPRWIAGSSPAMARGLPSTALTIRRSYFPCLADPAEAEKLIAAASAFAPSLPNFDPAE